MDTKIKNAPSLFSLQNDCLLMIFMFLNFEEIGRVDTSTTNRRDRETRLLPVLKTLTLPRVVLRSTTNESCIHSLRYLLLREIAVKEVAFPSKISETNLIMCARGLYIQPLKGLKSVSLSGCSKITDAGLASLAGGCAGLTSVDLVCCINITDAGLACLAGGCAGLTSVNQKCRMCRLQLYLSQQHQKTTSKKAGGTAERQKV